MSDYTVEPLLPGLWHINDGRDDSVYLLEGKTRALCLDTGLSTEPLLPLLRSLTSKPIDLALTHAHIDHMYRCNEFEGLLVGEGDIRAWNRSLRPLLWYGHRMYGIPHLGADPRRFRPLHDGDILDLGPRALRAISVPGHTPGSTVFVDDADRVIFTGDAFSSGEAAWMWLPGCSSISAYLNSLIRLLRLLEPCEGYTLLGGHRPQGLPDAAHPHRHPLTLDTLRDSVTLCRRMLAGELPGKPVHVAGLLPTRVYAHGTAAIVTQPRRLR